MPQLDKVTLFSQVFWLLFLYFFFFLIFLRYSLPIFSKVFKVRSCYISQRMNLSSLDAIKSFDFSRLLVKFGLQLKNNLNILQEYYSAEVTFLNSIFFKSINTLFIYKYIKYCLKFKFYKNYIFNDSQTN